MIRIAVVNDVPMAIEVLRRVVVALHDAEVAWIAENGEEAVHKCQADTPDLVLMDLIMPVTDGVEATRRIMLHCPCPILVVTATVKGNCDKVFEALGYGALDAVNTPVLGRDAGVSGGDELIRKIRSVMCLQRGGPAAFEVAMPSSTVSARPRSHGDVPLLAIGASTGGPQALATVLGKLGPLPGFAVVIVQHLDPLFIPGLAEWLGHTTKMSVQPIEAGQRPQAGTIQLACTPDHLVLTSEGVFQYVRQPVDYVYRPSVDVFFESLLKARVQSGVALLLTGMGRDGAVGMKALNEAGWKTIAQDQETSIVWGMPGRAVQLHAADQVLPVDRIGPAISEMTSRKER